MTKHYVTNDGKKEQKLSCSYNIVLDKEIKERLKKIQDVLVENFHEKRFYDSSPYAAMCTKFMGLSKAQEFVRAISDEFINDKPWKLGFSTSSSDNGTYIFLNFKKDTVDKIFRLIGE